MNRPPQHRPIAEPLHRLPSSHSMNQNANNTQSKLRPSSSNFSLAFPKSATVQSLMGRAHHHLRPSRTWTPSSGGLGGLLSDADDIQDRSIFVLEYNRLAKKHGVRLLIVEDFVVQQQDDDPGSPQKRSWLHRLFHGSSTHNAPNKAASTLTTKAPEHQLRPKRSVSDLSYLIHSRREPPKLLDIQALVRLSGRSVLYLPQEYSPCSLTLPTCIRATAQHIAQNAMTRGIFRIPGSVRIVNALFDYYCVLNNDGADVAGTVCCATLPTHIQYSIHDVASTFKRLLSVLPGGVLGSLALFDAFVGIHSHLHGEPEYPRTKQTKVRARLIALAIGTIESQFRRELICAVFGLLSLIGRLAEVSPREDADGRPLPTGDLMGYNALGIVFGPLLVGELLERYTMKLATPTSGLLVFPLSPRKQRREKQKQKSDGKPPEPPPVNKVMVANDIVEMLITNWRDMVRQMKALGTHHHYESSSMTLNRARRLSSGSESFVIKMPRELKEPRFGGFGALVTRELSPELETPTLIMRRRRLKPIRKDAGGHWLHPHSMHQHGQDYGRAEDLHDEKASRARKQVFFGFGKGKPATHGEGATGTSSPSLPVENCGGSNNHLHGIKSSSPTPPNKGPQHGSRPMLVGGSASSLTIISRSEDELSMPPADQQQHAHHNGPPEEGRQTRESIVSLGRASAASLLPDGDVAGTSSGGLGKASDMGPGSSSARQGSQEAFHSKTGPTLIDIVDVDKGNRHPLPPLPTLSDEGGAKNHELPNLKLDSLTSLNLSLATSRFRDWPSARQEKGAIGTANTHEDSQFPHPSLSEGLLRRNASMNHQSHVNPEHGLEQGQDASENHSTHSSDSQMPMKRRSVRAMAAMFESQQKLQHLTQGLRQPPPGGVEVTPMSKHARELLDRSNSAPVLALRGLDKPAWARDEEQDMDKVGTELGDRGAGRNLSMATDVQSRAGHGDHGPNGACTLACSGKMVRLEAQIEKLSLLLNDKASEAERLQRQLEKMSSEGASNELVKQARRDSAVWRDRAKAAEKKMEVFEKFITRVKGIRSSMAAESSRQSSANHQGMGWMKEEDKSSDEHDESFPAIPHVRFAKLMKNGGGSQGSGSDDSGVMGEETVVPARIRNCLHCSDSVRGRPRGVYRFDGDGVARSPDGCAENNDSGLVAVRMWSAVEDLLRMEEDPTAPKQRGSSVGRAQEEHEV